MPTKTLFSVWSLFDICLLVAGSATISVSVSWASPDLLRDLVLNESERKAGLSLGIYIIIVVAYSVFAILRRRAIYLKIFNLLLITVTLFAIIVASSLWILSLKQHKFMRSVWTDQSTETQVNIQNELHCCGFQNTTTSGLFDSNANTGFCADLDNKVGCMRPLIRYSNDYLNQTFSTIYSFVVILICLFLTTVCIINERAKEDRFRRIDAKRNVNKFAD